MREILFRGGWIKNGEWIEGYYVFLNDTHYILEAESEDWGVNGEWFQVVPKSVGQYTGLKDKNGKKIFEGDILKDDWGKIFKVFFTTRSCSFMVRCEHSPNEWETGDYRLGEAWCNTIRVIGNIYDNQELFV